jgi:methylenetetrahydrofolate reductase (NADPH)
MIDFSIEFFPPSSPAMEDKLWRTYKTLKKYNPSLISVTYGADGSTRDRTHKIVKKLIKEKKILVAPHLTCVGSTKQEISKILSDYAKLGIQSVVALRGDKPKQNDSLMDLRFATDLIEEIKKIQDYKNIFVAAYPEIHPESKSIKEDIAVLKLKEDLGATHAITQFFFDNNFYYEYLNLCAQQNISIPIIPGILPINNFERVFAFAQKCNASIPKSMIEAYKNISSNEDNLKLSLSLLVDQVEALKQNGVKNYHFYSLNQSELLESLFKSFE